MTQPFLVLDRAVARPIHTNGWHPTRNGHVPRAIVLHLIEGTIDACRSWFKSPEAKVGAHFAVTRMGDIDQFVSVGDTANANGIIVRPTWPGLIAGVNPNLYTLSIEHEGGKHDRWSGPMLTTSVALSVDLLRLANLRPSRDTLVLHRWIRADKDCPGDWLVQYYDHYLGLVTQLFNAVTGNRASSTGHDVGDRRWSDFSGKNIVLERYHDDDNWWFTIEGGDGRLIKAGAPWSSMPPAR